MPQTQHYEMKDSGVEWIGKMPSHWSASPFKKIIAQNDGGVWGEDPIDNDGAVVLRSTEQTVDGKWNIEQPAKRDLSHVAKLRYYKLEIGDLLITKSSGSALHIGKTSIVDADIAKLHCFYSNFMQRVRLKQNVMPKLYWYIMNSSIARYQFVFLQNSTSGIGNINSKHIDNIIVPVPPLVEQTAIAAYLDEKCATIDAIIAEAKASIEEYKSWKASVIFETVTKGLNPNAEMKDSGVEWIGSIPKAWQYVPLKYLASCNDEVLTEATPEDYTFDYIDIGSVHTGNGIGMCERMQFKDAPSRARRIVRDGDIIVSTVRTYLKAIVQVGNYDVPHIASTGFAVIRTKNANASFLKYALLSDNFVSQVEADSVGISYPAINATQIMAFKIPVPSIAEQTDIALYLDDKCAAIDGVIAEKEALIGELESYKKSLIFETVTGKRRVC